MLELGLELGLELELELELETMNHIKVSTPISDLNYMNNNHFVQRTQTCKHYTPQYCSSQTVWSHSDPPK